MPLDEHGVGPDPIREVGRWLEQAREAGIPNADAAALATAGADGAPSVRFVLVRRVDARGLVFYTGRESRKGRELAANPRAALAFYWVDLGRQVRVTGPVEDVSRKEAEAYFRSRPLGNRLAAWASRQSEPIASRETLERRYADMEERYAGGDVPLPPFWGGYRIVPAEVELWEHRESRLHDRLRYTRLPQGGWRLERLSP
jgi:pyridoxamine 5'-phosphate oxidase